MFVVYMELGAVINLIHRRAKPWLQTNSTPFHDTGSAVLVDYTYIKLHCTILCRVSIPPSITLGVL